MTAMSTALLTTPTHLSLKLSACAFSHQGLAGCPLQLREAKRIGKCSQMLKTLSSGIAKLPGIFRSTYHFHEGQGWMCLKAFLFRGHLVFIIIAVTLCKRLVTVITFAQVPASHHSHAGDQNWNTLDIPLHLNLSHSSSGIEMQFTGSSR